MFSPAFAYSTHTHHMYNTYCMHVHVHAHTQTYMQTFQGGNNMNREFWKSRKRVKHEFGSSCILSLYPVGPNLRDGKIWWKSRLKVEEIKGGIKALHLWWVKIGELGSLVEQCTSIQYSSLIVEVYCMAGLGNKMSIYIKQAISTCGRLIQ